jgi:hypothetical protein
LPQPQGPFETFVKKKALPIDTRAEISSSKKHEKPRKRVDDEQKDSTSGGAMTTIRSQRD